MNKDPFITRKRLLALAIAATLGLSACKKESPEEQLSQGEAAGAPQDSASLGAAVDDATITSDVKNRLAADARTRNAQIEVSSSQGTVTLTGTSPTAEARSAAEEIARNVAAVQGIDNRIEAPSALDDMSAKAEGAASDLGARAESAADTAGENVSDAVITTKVKAKLASDDQVAARDINVSTEAGVVELKGEVPSEQARQRALELARNTEGVKSVDDDQLKVSQRS